MHVCAKAIISSQTRRLGSYRRSASCRQAYNRTADGTNEMDTRGRQLCVSMVNPSSFSRNELMLLLVALDTLSYALRTQVESALCYKKSNYSERCVRTWRTRRSKRAVKEARSLELSCAVIAPCGVAPQCQPESTSAILLLKISCVARLVCTDRSLC
ncbi:hypothetical protein BAUCODRAFT_467626 [Baudoinia panamericana UAMH 10762]|uniref:Uncharacterized protein n=1 Tax=Baudoinia panamericana (strain UAMH 10762) TaxID=717646 RepID=M2MXE5_BAUPA|nr:uncharacterized protein BAUCODRAFT_467626 [Baudoinia panamericana UAMH 10762]EMC96233.1 hypothetical protein BAUCODRAFT_467626 [Baudoinia panamericana UAMH 10762]